MEDVRVMVKNTDHGFEWDSVSVNRLWAENQKGRKVLGVTTPKQDISIYITKTGKVGVYGKDGREWIA